VHQIFSQCSCSSYKFPLIFLNSSCNFQIALEKIIECFFVIVFSTHLC
jgi:hypothetical protein